MKSKKKKSVVKAVFIYLLLTTGIWTFMMSYSNSYNRLTTEKISPASLVVSGDKAEVKILKRTFSLNLEKIMPESKLYFLLYMISPDELRTCIGLVSLTDKL